MATTEFPTNAPLLEMRCPQHQEVTLELLGADTLKCPECKASFPLIKGVPRFVYSEHLESFGLQWNKYEVAHADEDRKTFQAKTGITLEELKGLKVLDAGCGGGRYSKVAGEAGATVVGADHSHAVEKASQLCSHLPNVQFLQGDLKHLPLQTASFDFVFSIGVMHHDKNTKKVFDSVAKMVKPGGRYSVWLYRKNQWWQEFINTYLRIRTTHWSTKRLEQLSKIGAFFGGLPVVKQTLNKVVNFSSHPNWENRVCDTFDWYAPQYQYHHTIEELSDWFTQAGFGELKVLEPEKTGGIYRWTYNNNLLIGSGVNVTGRKLR